MTQKGRNTRAGNEITSERDIARNPSRLSLEVNHASILSFLWAKTKKETRSERQGSRWWSQVEVSVLLGNFIFSVLMPMVPTLFRLLLQVYTTLG